MGIVGKTIIRHGSERLKAEFLPKILRNEVEFAVGYSEPNAGSDAASMQLKATRDGDGWRLNGQKTWTTSAHFAEWYWVGARTDPDAPSTPGITLFLVPLDHPGITVNAIWTMGDERTNEVYLDNVFVPDDYVVGELNQGFQYISEALDLERFTMFTFSPIAQRLDLLCEYVAGRHPRRPAAEGRPRGAPPHRPARHPGRGGPGARAALRRRVAEGRRRRPRRRPRSTSCIATELSRRLANASMDIAGPGSPAAGEDARRAHGGPGRVDLPLHGDRHHRRRHLGDPEEHHRPPQASGSPRTSDAARSVRHPPRPAGRASSCSTCPASGPRRAAPGCWPTTGPPW